MIVYTMNEDELNSEILKDMPNILKYSDYFDSEFRRIVIKSRKFPVVLTKKFKSSNKNNWILVLEARTKKETGDLSRIHFITYINSPHGYYVVMPTSTNNHKHLIIYPPHFFRRYSERMDIHLSGIELITHFFKYNYNYVYSTKDVKITPEEFTREIYGSCKEGIALGVCTTKDNVLFKTFITYEMCKGAQIEEFSKNEQLRKEIHEKELV